MKNKIGFICIGQAGGNIGKLLKLKSFDVCFVNSSQGDLDTIKGVDEKHKYHIKNGLGCEKERLTAKLVAKEDFTDINKFENEISIVLKHINFLTKNYMLSDICLTIQNDLLEIESNIKAYERQKDIKIEKEQTKTIPFSVAENKPKEKLKDEEISLFNNNYYNEIKSQEQTN